MQSITHSIGKNVKQERAHQPEKRNDTNIKDGHGLGRVDKTNDKINTNKQ